MPPILSPNNNMPVDRICRRCQTMWWRGNGDAVCFICGGEGVDQWNRVGLGQTGMSVSRTQCWASAGGSSCGIPVSAEDDIGLCTWHRQRLVERGTTW